MQKTRSLPELRIAFWHCPCFFPANSYMHSEICLLLEIEQDRGISCFPADKGNAQVVNCPYASASFMSTPLSELFARTLHGACSARVTSAEEPLNLEITLTGLPCRESNLLDALLKPLVESYAWQASCIDRHFPDLDPMPSGTLIIYSRGLLKNILAQICLFLPFLGCQNSYAPNEATF